MVENAQIFQQVLMNDEQVIKVFKPHKGRFWASRFLGHLPIAFFFLIFFGIMVVGFSFSMRQDPNIGLAMGAIVAIIVGFFLLYLLLFFAIEMISGVLWYKNRWYCFTNRRVIIQCGILGRNFRFLDLNQNMNSFVRISVLDRMLRKNTGSIKFWTMMNPGMNFGGGGWGAGGGRGMGTTPGFSGSMFYFMYVQNPHEILREVQAQVQQNQNQQVNLLQQIAQNTMGNNMGNMGGNMGNMNNNQGFNNNQQQNWNNNNQGFNNQNQNWNNNSNNNNNNNNNNW